MPADPDQVRRVMTWAGRLEREWSGKVMEPDPRYLPFMPFSIPEFIKLVAEALPEADGNLLLDVGCGPGSKMLVARDVFGLEVAGVERVPQYAAEARRAGLNVLIGDAADFPDYGLASLIWLYRPCRDPGLQAALEKIVWDRAAPGAVLMGAGLEAPPAGWHVILDDWERQRGIWMKPPHP